MYFGLYRLHLDNEYIKLGYWLLKCYLSLIIFMNLLFKQVVA